MEVTAHRSEESGFVVLHHLSAPPLSLSVCFLSIETAWYITDVSYCAWSKLDTK